MDTCRLYNLSRWTKSLLLERRVLEPDIVVFISSCNRWNQFDEWAKAMRIKLKADYQIRRLGPPLVEENSESIRD